MSPDSGQGRDPERTPMPWNDSPSAGFTTGTPWLPLGDNAASTVAALEHDPRSILMLYRRLIDLRRARPTLISGKLQGVLAENGVLRYERAEPRGPHPGLAEYEQGFRASRYRQRNCSRLNRPRSRRSKAKRNNHAGSGRRTHPQSRYVIQASCPSHRSPVGGARLNTRVRPVS